MMKHKNYLDGLFFAMGDFQMPPVFSRRGSFLFPQLPAGLSDRTCSKPALQTEVKKTP
jgi:hypothetical protein